jgi:hypothetical protein
MNIKELFSLAGKGIKNFDKIVEGVWNEINLKTLSEAQKKEILNRTKACAECPYNSINARNSEEYFKLYGKHYHSSRKDEHCGICGCVLKYKITSFSSNCGLETHNQRHPETKQELKWKAFREQSN